MTTYTPANYEQDKRIAQNIYNKNFKGHFLKDDLIQVAITELWKLRKQKGCPDLVLLYYTAHKKMISFLRKEMRHMGMDSLNRHVADDPNLRLFDVIAIEQPTAQECCEYRELVKKLFPLQITLSEQRKQVIALHLKHYTQTEIARKIGTSIPYVNRIIQSFRKLAREILDGGDI